MNGYTLKCFKCTFDIYVIVRLNYFCHMQTNFHIFKRKLTSFNSSIGCIHCLNGKNVRDPYERTRVHTMG